LRAILARPPAGAPAAVRLTDLDLSHNEALGDEGARFLAGCEHVQHLSALRLARCGIGDEGARALAKSPHLDRVEVLDVENNPIGDNGFRAFLDTRYWRALRRLMPPRTISPHIYNRIDQKFNRPPRRG